RRVRGEVRHGARRRPPGPDGRARGDAGALEGLRRPRRREGRRPGRLERRSPHADERGRTRGGRRARRLAEAGAGKGGAAMMRLAALVLMALTPAQEAGQTVALTNARILT